jgi:hypothetical protein
MIRLVLRKARSFMAVPLFVKLWLLPAWVLLGIGRIAVLCVPFRTIARCLGEELSTAASIPLLTTDQISRAAMVGQTVRLAARYAPWDANCFPQAIAAAALLKIYKIPYSIFFGLRKDALPSNGLAAHAWTMSGRIAVTGGRSFRKFTVVGTFARWK